MTYNVKTALKKLGFDLTAIEQKTGAILMGLTTVLGTAAARSLKVSVHPQRHANGIAAHAMELTKHLRASLFSANMVQQTHTENAIYCRPRQFYLEN
jgi:hypothetical protein